MIFDAVAALASAEGTFTSNTASGNDGYGGSFSADAFMCNATFSEQDLIENTAANGFGGAISIVNWEFSAMWISNWRNCMLQKKQSKFWWWNLCQLWVLEETLQNVEQHRGDSVKLQFQPAANMPLVWAG